MISRRLCTRDMVRQAVADWMQMVRSLKACGETMLLDDGTEQHV